MKDWFNYWLAFIVFIGIADLAMLIYLLYFVSTWCVLCGGV